MSLKLDRLIRLFDILSPNAWTNAERIAVELEVDRRTVYRYVREADMAFSPFPILESGPMGYRLQKNDFLEILQSRNDYLGIAAAASGPLGSLLSASPKLSQRLLDMARDIVETRTAVPERTLRTILSGAQDGSYVTIEYKAKSEIRVHTLVPIKLFMNSGLPYLVGFDKGYGHMICLGLHKVLKASKGKSRIESVTLTELRSYLNSAWGMMVRHKEKKTTCVSFKASPAVSPYFFKSPLHSLQAFSESGVSSIFTLPVHNEDEFARFILRFGRSVKIISPESAVRSLKSFLDSMVLFYDKKTAFED
jgi:predicted DNA-binding transcriptional regulator YafY